MMTTDVNTLTTINKKFIRLNDCVVEQTLYREDGNIIEVIMKFKKVQILPSAEELLNDIIREEDK